MKGEMLPEMQINRIANDVEYMYSLIAKPNEATAKEILLAIMKGRNEDVKRMLENGTDPNQADEYGKTVLHYAIKCSTDEHLFRLLLEYGANVNASTKYKQFTPIHFAVQFNKTKFVQLLLEWRADLNARTTDGLSPVMIAILFNSTDIAKLLIDHGANLNHSITSSEWTPLHLASFLGNNDIVRHLIRNGADVNIALRNSTIYTPLFLATNHYQTETAELLLNSGAKTDGADFFASYIYAKKKKWQLLTKLLSAKVKDRELLTIALNGFDGGNFLLHFYKTIFFQQICLLRSQGTNTFLSLLIQVNFNCYKKMPEVKSVKFVFNLLFNYNFSRKFFGIYRIYDFYN